MILIYIPKVDLLTMYRIGGVSTQGRVRGVQWVTVYKINYSVDAITFDTVQDTLTYPATDKVGVFIRFITFD